MKGAAQNPATDLCVGGPGGKLLDSPRVGACGIHKGKEEQR